MISLRKYLERNPEELYHATLDSYRSALAAMSDCGSKACPTLGSGLRQSLYNLQARLAESATPDQVRATRAEVDRELESWGGRASEYYREKAEEAKEVMILLTQAAADLAGRDQRYCGRLQEFTGQLEAMAGLDDLAEVRRSLERTAGELKTCVAQMVLDSQDTVQSLRNEISAYRKQLEDADLVASRDALTGLDNRSSIEARIERFIGAGRPFTILMLDLNGFKAVNDQFGHLAGDEILRQFARELRSAVRAVDTVGRWGGDEFVLVMEDPAADAAAYADRIRRLTFGKYTFEPAGSKRQVKVEVTAAIGAATWQPGESAKELFVRADAAMYGDKKARGGR